MLTKLFARLSYAIGVAVLALWLPSAPAFADPWISSGAATSSCVGAYGAVSCASRWSEREGTIRPRQRTEQEIAEAAERDRKWVARCKPVIRQDRYGVERYSYAAPGCEFGKTED
jgi:hypothetical protein